MFRRHEHGGRAGPRPAELPTVNMLVRLTRTETGDVADGPAVDGPAVNGPAEDGGRAGDPDGGRAGGGTLASRIEDVRPAGSGRPLGFRVAAPDYAGDLLDPDPDETWLMSWVTERARWELPVHRTDAGGPGPRSWWLVPAGPAQRRQRRRFYRAECGVPVELDQLREPFGTLSGNTLDISEGGVRCLLPFPDDGSAQGTRVLVRLALDGLDGVIEGVVLRSRRPARPGRVAGWLREVAVAFDDPERYGDALRPIVVRLQLRARRLAPPSAR